MANLRDNWEDCILTGKDIINSVHDELEAIHCKKHEVIVYYGYCPECFEEMENAIITINTLIEPQPLDGQLELYNSLKKAIKNLIKDLV